jgi:hypothetical protein
MMNQERGAFAGIVEAMNREASLLIIFLVCCSAFAVNAQPAPSQSDERKGGVCTRWEARIVDGRKVEKAPISATGEKADQSTSPPLSVPKGQDSIAGLFGDPDPDQVATLSDQEALDAIGCLLNMKDDRRPASFGGVTNPYVSQFFAIPPANLAALYYVSYIFSKNWFHGGAIALRGPHAEASNSQSIYVTRQESISAAYGAYQRWFAEVKRVGLLKAREESLNPLSGTGLEWYGPAGPPSKRFDSSQ